MNGDAGTVGAGSERPTFSDERFRWALLRIRKDHHFFASSETLSDDQLVILASSLRESTSAIEVRLDGCKLEGDVDFRNLDLAEGSDFSGAAFLGNATFSGCRFLDTADFTGATFDGLASFEGVKFDGNSHFTAATFRGVKMLDTHKDSESNEIQIGGNFSLGRDPMFCANFRDANFSCETYFDAARFIDASNFHESTFGGHVTFRHADFDGAARFEKTKFKDEADFSQSHFRSDVDFGHAKFESTELAAFATANFDARATFDNARFSGDVTFHASSFASKAFFSDVYFGGNANFNAVTLGTDARFVRAQFNERVEFFGANRIDASRARFYRGFKISATENGEVSLNDAQIGASSRIEPISSNTESSRLPCVKDLRYTDVQNLDLTGVDLSWCHFLNAHHLSEVGIEGAITFGQSPKSRVFPPRLVTRRRVIADERQWWIERGQEAWSEGLSTNDLDVPGTRTYVNDGNGTRQVPNLDAMVVAASYRALRRGLETRRETELAGDFYYGEMQMRRKGTSNPSLHALLLVYWAISGYGTRALRTLTWLLLVIAAFSAFFANANVVLAAPKGLPTTDAITLAVGSSINFFKPPPESYGLNNVGERAVIVLHLLSVLLAALFVLALRARVRR